MRSRRQLYQEWNKVADEIKNMSAILTKAERKALDSKNIKEWGLNLNKLRHEIDNLAINTLDNIAKSSKPICPTCGVKMFKADSDDVPSCTNPACPKNQE